MIKNLLLVLFGIISLIAILNWLNMAGPLTMHPRCSGSKDSGRIASRPECNDSLRYNLDDSIAGGGGTAITTVVADSLASRFEVKYLDSVHVKESYFSKKAVDHLFAKHPKANAIGCRYALSHDSLIIILNCYRINQVNIYIPPSMADSTDFVSKTLCPPTCPHPQ